MEREGAKRRGATVVNSASDDAAPDVFERVTHVGVAIRIIHICPKILRCVLLHCTVSLISSSRFRILIQESGFNGYMNLQKSVTWLQSSTFICVSFWI
jgi:hypothetical protein